MEELLRAIILGIVQGVTEFLPVSSSGHLLVLKNIWDMGEVPILFDVLLHLATLLVVIWFFRELILTILKACLHWITRKVEEEDRHYLRIAVMVIIGSVATAVLGFILLSFGVLQTTTSASICFLLTASLLISTRYTKPKEGQNFRLRNGFWVGIAQGLGTLPGISRSGITISTALWLGIDRKRAGELSFILSIPAILGALLLKAGDAGDLAQHMAFSSVAAGFIAAVISGYFSLKLLIWLIGSGKLYYFSIYLIPLGIIGLVWL